MTTMIELIEKVLLNVEGYNGDSDIYGTLAEDITSTDSSFTVAGATFADGSGFSTGLIEVGTELCYVQNIDRMSAPTEFSGILRGFRGTEANAWDSGTRVRNNPRYPVSAVKNAINFTIQSLYPRLVATNKFEFTGNTSRVQYDLPDDCLDVLSVQLLTTGSSKAWVPLNYWSFDTFAGSNANGTKSINVRIPQTGRPVQIVYAKEALSLDYSNVFTDSGLPSWLEEVVILGSCWRLTSFIDSARVSQTTAEQSLINSSGMPINSGGSATSLAKYYLGIYEQQIAQAQKRQSRELPMQKHRLI